MEDVKNKNMNTLEFVKNEIKNDCNSLASQYDIEVIELNFGEVSDIIFLNNTLEFVFEDGYVIYSDEPNEKASIGKQFTCAFKTPKGYISKKKLPVEIKNCYRVTLIEATELLKYNTDALENTYDPFWHENEAKRKNAIAWNYIANNHIQADVDSF